MPISADGSFQRLHNWTAHAANDGSLNPAVMDAELDDIGRSLSELARVARGGAPIKFPDQQAPLTRQQVIEIVEELLKGWPGPAPQASADLSPLIARLDAIEIKPATPGVAPDLAPLLAQLTALETRLTETRAFVYQAVVADRRRREALAATEDATPAATVKGSDGTAHVKYPLLSALQPGADNAALKKLADGVWSRDSVWAELAAARTIKTAVELDTAIDEFLDNIG